MTTPLRNDDAAPADEREHRFRVYRLCDCETCGGRGREAAPALPESMRKRCGDCRGEGKVRELVFEADDEAGLGMGIVTAGREGEFADCPIGILDTHGAVGEKWLIRPWLPSARNVSEAGRTLGQRSAAQRRERDE